MGYVDTEFYKKTYMGNTIPDKELQSALDKASREVDILTRMRIKTLGGIENLSDFEQTQVKLAVCSQADYNQVSFSLGGVNSYSIGDVSVSVSDEGKYDKACVSYLSSTRLMYRGL